MEYETKRNWEHSVPVPVELVQIKTAENGKKIERLELTTDIGLITYKPKKIVTESSEFSGIKTVEEHTEMYNIEEFLAQNKLVTELAKNTKKAPQEVILSYCEISRFDEQTQTEVWHKYMHKGQFNSLYYEKFDKDKKKLDSQKQAKEKAEKKQTL